MKHVHGDHAGTSTSVWMEAPISQDYPPLTRDEEADVGIVGAGIAGLTTAYFLAKAGKNVIVLDDGSIGGGESERTTAHITYALDDRYYLLQKHHGKEGAALAAESHSTALDTIERIIKDERIDCAFERIDGFLFQPEDGDDKQLKREYEAIKEAGMTAVTLEKSSPLQSFNTGPCLRFPHQGQFHIVRYLQGLARAITRQKGKIFLHTHISSVQSGEKPSLFTSDDYRIHVRNIVIATNAPIDDDVSIYSKQAPYRTYVIGVQIPRGYTKKALYWDTEDPYHYVRIYSDEKEKDDLLIVGGEDHKTGQADDGEDRFDRLEEWTRERFPKAGKRAYAWSGQVMEPADGLALIGRHPHQKNTYICTGDSGNGMTHGTIAGLLLTDLILGRKNPWEALYDPSRTALKAAGEFLKENMNVAGQYAKWLTGSGTKKHADHKREAGRVLKEGTKTIALYTDDAGKEHRLSAVCPHKGCIVAWNSLEQSWDCPCHGSRFDAQGKVINGPSIADLSKLD